MIKLYHKYMVCHWRLTKRPPSTRRELPVQHTMKCNSDTDPVSIPVTYLARSLARNTAGPAISSGAKTIRVSGENDRAQVNAPPSLPRTVRETIALRFWTSARSSLLMSVAVNERNQSGSGMKIQCLPMVPGRIAFALQETSSFRRIALRKYWPNVIFPQRDGATLHERQNSSWSNQLSRRFKIK